MKNILRTILGGNPRIFVDLDGTLAKFEYVPYEELYKEGYFEELEPDLDLISVIKDTHESRMADVYILSCYLSDSPYAYSEKLRWIKRYISYAMGELVIPYSYLKECKEILKEFVENFVSPGYGVDDFTFIGSVDKAIDEKNDITLQFFGSGKWTFEKCAKDPEWFFNTEENPAGKKLVEYFADTKDLMLPMCFVDEECGNQVLYRYTGRWYTEDGELKSDGLVEHFDHNPQNLEKLGY